jgi:hypothetical protein
MDTLATSGAATPAPAAQPAVNTEQPATPAAVKPAETAPGATLATGKVENLAAKDPVADPAVEPKYELKTPEGFAGDINQVVEFAKANKISPEAAQKIVEREHALRADAIKARDDEAIKSWETRVGNWANEVKADKELGGANLSKTQENALRVLKKYDADGSFAKELNSTGYGNHPTVLRFLTAIGKAMAEDTFISGSQASAQRDPAAILFPTMHKGN